MPLNFKKPLEWYGNLIWQDNVLYSRDGRVLPKDPAQLVANGFEVQLALRSKLFIYQDEIKLQQEYETQRQLLEEMRVEREREFQEKMQQARQKAIADQNLVQGYEPVPVPQLPQLEVPLTPEELAAGRANVAIDQGRASEEDDADIDVPDDADNVVLGGGPPSTNWATATLPPLPVITPPPAPAAKPKRTRRPVQVDV